MLQTLIVGYGRSGRQLHAPCVARARGRWSGPPIFASGRPYAIDPITPLARAGRRAGDAILRKALDDLDDLRPDSIVAHVCTPPADRARIIEMLCAAGIRRVIVEKPLAGSVEELERVSDVVREHDMEVAVALPWLSSSVTYRLRELLDAPPVGSLRSVQIVQEKPRFARSLERVDHPSTFDVEIPHALGLMVHLAGPPLGVKAAACGDMQVEGITIPYLGEATLMTVHENGVTAEMRCDLTSPIRRREVRLTCSGAIVSASYPVGSEDLYGQVVVAVEGSPPSRREVLFDDAFTTLFLEWYAYFAREGPRPASGLELNESVVRTLEEAKRISGVPIESTAWGPAAEGGGVG